MVDRTDRRSLTSDVVLLRADDVAAGPVARVALPYRVPSGLPGTWLDGHDGAGVPK